MAARKLKVSTTGYKENSKDKNLKELYVPSPNLTMTNVNRRVKATPVYENGSYGMPITMMPGVPNYSFPGAVGVIEKKLRKAQLVGEVPPEYETVNVTDPNDPAYQEYLYLQNLYNWSNLQDFDRRHDLSFPGYYGVKDGDYTLFPASEYSERYDNWTNLPYNDFTLDGKFNDNRSRSENYNTDETGYYGSKANRYTFNTQAELDNFIATNRGLNPSMYGNRGTDHSGAMQQIIDKYAPIGYDAMVDWNHPKIKYYYRYNGPPSKQIFIRPITPVLEDVVDREALRKIYPGYSDEEIDEVVATNRLTPSYVTNTYGDYGENQYISFNNPNEDPNYVHPNVVKQQPYDVYDDNGDITGKTNVSPKDWSPRAGVTGYLPEDIVDYDQTQRANYLPRFGPPESYLGKKYVYTEPEKVQESNENYTLQDSGNPGVSYLHYKKNNDDGTYTSKFLGATLTSQWLDDEQQNEFYSPSGGTARVNYNPDIKIYSDVKDANSEVEKFRKQQKNIEKRRAKEANTPAMSFQKGGDISVPDLRRVTINALPKAQIMGQFKPSYDWRVSPLENAELNRRAELAGHNSVDEYRTSGWAWQPKQYQTPSVQDQVFTGRYSLPKDDADLPTMTKSKIPGLSTSTNPDARMLQQKEAADVAEWVDTNYKEESPEEREKRNKESFIKYMTTPGKEDLEKVNKETGYANAAYTSRFGEGPKLGGMSLWDPEAIAGSGINDTDVSDYLNKVYNQQQEDEKVAQTTIDLAFSKDEQEKKDLRKQLKIQKKDAFWAGSDADNSEFLKKMNNFQEGRQESIREHNMYGIAQPTFGPLDAIVSLPALSATLAMPILGTSLTLGSAVNPFFYAAGINGFLNPNSDFSQAAEAWSKGTGKGEDVLWEAALNSLNFLGTKSLPTDIGNFGKAYKEIATGESIIPYAWRSPAVGLSQEKSYEMFNSLLNSGKMTPAERSIVVEYQHDPHAFTGRYASVDPVKRSALNDIISKYELQFPQNSNAIATRRFSFDKAGKSTLGADVQGRNINFGDRPTSFSAGVGLEGYAGAPDRLVIPSRYLPKMKNNFIAQDYAQLSQEELQLLENPSLKDFASGIGKPQQYNTPLEAEKELIGTGLEFKQIGKVKNDIGGYDVIVKPRNVKAGTSTTKNATGQPQWVKPSKTQLKQEFKVEHELKGNNYFASEAEFQRAVDEAKIEEITPELDQAIQNKSRHGSREEMIESNKNYKSWPKYRNENTIDGIYEGMQSGAKMDMPIVLEFQDGTRKMFSGNTRMDVAFQSGKNPEALIVKVPEASAAGESGSMTLDKWPQLFGKKTPAPVTIPQGPQAELDLANARAKTFSESAFNKLKLQRFRPGQTFDVSNQEARFMDDPELAKLYNDYHASDPTNPKTFDEWFKEGEGQYGPSGRYGSQRFGDTNDIVAINKVNEVGEPSKNILIDVGHETTHSRSLRLKSTQEERDIAMDAWQPMINTNMVNRNQWSTGPASGLNQAAEESFSVQNELRTLLNDFDGSRVYTNNDIPEIQNALQKLASQDHPYLTQDAASQIDMKKLIKSLNVIGLGVTVPLLINATKEQKKRGGGIKNVDFIASRNKTMFQKGGTSYDIPEEPYRDPKIVRQEGREYYDPHTETIYMRPSYPNVIHEAMVQDHELEHHKQKLKGKLSSTEYWPGPLKEPVGPLTEDMIFPYYNRTTEDVFNIMDSVPKSTLFGIPEDIAVMGFQNKTYETPGTAEYEAEYADKEPRTLRRGNPVIHNAVANAIGRQEQDPEMMFRDKYNTELTKEEQKDFNKWAKEESKKQGRDILMDKGAYDIQGFWKSGDFKKMDKDNHGTDTWKKPNHPTFSNQSKYNGAGGWYGGNWTEEAGYQPSKQTLDRYGFDYYNWLFGEEPNRPEHLDMNRYDGENMATPIVYKQGGSVKKVKIKSLPKNWKTQ